MAFAGKPRSYKSDANLQERGVPAKSPARPIKVHVSNLLPSTGALRCNETLAPPRSQ
jgi:hypothetical protein